jgi:3',5'-cyclic AMP phosphodiesterase CpdA
MSSPPVLFSVGLFSDVQFANRENQGKCRYRDSLDFLAEAVECFNARDLQAVINLGDLVDSNEASHLDSVMAVLEKSAHPFIHVLGNHDLLGPMERRDIQDRLGITNSWGERLRRDNWRVIVVDSTEVSLVDGSKHRALANKEIARLSQQGDPCAENWNGMAGKRQMLEISKLLRNASDAGDRALVLNHMVAGINSGSLRHRCWNHSKLTRLLEVSSCVVGHFNGHDHDGGFATDEISGVHYLTLPAICDSVGGVGAHAIAHFEKNSITIEGWGRVKSRRLHFYGT